MKLSAELKLRGVEVGDTYTYTYTYTKDGGVETAFSIGRVDNYGCLEQLLSGLYDKGTTFLWLVDINGNKKERIKVKLSEELRIRGAMVGDFYAYTRNLDVSPYTCRVHNSEFLKNLLLGQDDEVINFLWLVDENGNKKERLIK